ncbi:MAG: retroviral-like aspartic protease family protein [Gammaproteobacteria bacterium]|nr:retroviral-like aspartic protease family protein [Gammaproteobacteria bacterium]MDH3448526.1 retroviral-like aspartic protease family protein [Gammaproteobacteria bacterium]
MKATAGIIALLLALILGAAFAEEGKVRVIALFANKALLQVGDKQKIVKKGETFEGVLLQSASGRGAVVVIDGKAVELGINQAIAGNFKKAQRSGLRIYPDSLGMYYVEGEINGQSTRFLVDTGATFVTLSGAKARSLRIDYRKGIASTAQTASAIVPVWQIRLDSVSIGGIQVSNVDATVIAGDQPFEVLLGNSFLQHTRIQKAGSMLEIEKRF